MTASDSSDMLTAGPTFVERGVEADGFQIRCLEAGAGPTVVFLHGAGGPSISRAHALLAERHRVVLLEMPGFGASPVNERTATAAELARTVATAVERLGIERFSLWGHSFGGRIACWLAVQYPERIETLILAAPAAILPDPPSVTSGDPPARSQSPAATADPVQRAKHMALIHRVRGPRRDADLEARLAALPVPTLVLFGADDRVISPELGRIYRQLIPSCHFVLVYDAGHAPDTDRPEAFVSVVADFIERREQFVVTRTSSLIHP